MHVLGAIPLPIALPVTGVGLAALIAIILRSLLLDKSSFEQQKGALEEQQKEMTALQKRVKSLEDDVVVQRSEKHRVRTELARAELIIHIVNGLKKNCTCDALEVLDPILNDFMASLTARRSTDLQGAA